MKVDFNTLLDNGDFHPAWWNFHQHFNSKGSGEMLKSLKNDYKAEVTGWAILRQVITFQSPKYLTLFLLEWT
jgi:hypothetical protein